MRSQRLPLTIFLIIVVVAGVSAFLVMRARSGAETGPPIALCPGPDQYGYRCQPGSGLAYIDATNDTGLYADDGLVMLDLPFPFTFYGTVYQQIQVSSNGNIQFTTENPTFSNECLHDGPAAGLGDMIAPYWDDLDLTFLGYLETAVAGTGTSRIFVIEWDSVPSYANPEDLVTFEVQLFEGSNDIVFLYEDVSRSQGDHGREATIGLQSESQGFALQHGCNQLALSSGQVIQFLHPEESNQNAAHSPLSPHLLVGSLTVDAAAKGDTQLLIERLNQQGLAALPTLRTHWLSRQPQQDSQWLQADITGDGLEELIILWRPPLSLSHLTHLAVLSPVSDNAGNQSWQLLYHSYPLARREGIGHLELEGISDETADGLLDILIWDSANEQSYLLTQPVTQFAKIALIATDR